MSMDGKLRSMVSVFLVEEDRVCLLYRQGSRVVNDKWIGTAGGHMEGEEIGDAKAAMVRELGEETGLTEEDLQGLTIRYMVMRNTGKELRQNYYFFAAPKEKGLLPSSNEGTCRWFSKEEVKELPMPDSTKDTILHWFAEGRYTDKLYIGINVGGKIAFSELPEV